MISQHQDHEVAVVDVRINPRLRPSDARGELFPTSDKKVNHGWVGSVLIE